MAGRDEQKLGRQRDRLATPDIDLIVADSSDQGSVDAMVSSAKCIISTAGPYQKFGTPVVEACARLGTDYVDLCGEPNWMRQMIDAYEAAARASGARILFSGGFDSVPSELGVWHCQQIATNRYGKPMPRVRGRVKTFVGGPSGGSVASGMAMMKAAQESADVAALLGNPFALTPGFRGPEHPSDQTFETEPDVGPVGPFTLGPTDAKNVHRSNFLMGHPYGKDFIYDEKMIGATPPAGPPPSLDKLPKPGEGPGAEIMEKGKFEILFIGSDGQGREVRTSVSGSRDPGYATTSRIVSEVAIGILASDSVPGGIWTPGAVLKAGLIKRLEAHADMRFEEL
jgi:short subunit dehydrogenase-like uncharacterized protein